MLLRASTNNSPKFEFEEAYRYVRVYRRLSLSNTGYSSLHSNLFNCLRYRPDEGKDNNT
jgi:hypothetical protein